MELARALIWDPLFTKDVAKCWSKSGQNQGKIKEFGPNQVRMAPFGAIFSQNGSYRVWDASRALKGPMGPGPWSRALLPSPGPWSWALVPGPGPWSRALVPGPGPWALVPGPCSLCLCSINTPQTVPNEKQGFTKKPQT